MTSWYYKLITIVTTVVLLRKTDDSPRDGSLDIPGSHVLHIQQPRLRILFSKHRANFNLRAYAYTTPPRTPKYTMKKRDTHTTGIKYYHVLLTEHDDKCDSSRALHYPT